MNADIEKVRELDQKMRASSFGWSLQQEARTDGVWLVCRATGWDAARATAAIDAYFGEEKRGPR